MSKANSHPHSSCPYNHSSDHFSIRASEAASHHHPLHTHKGDIGGEEQKPLEILKEIADQATGKKRMSHIVADLMTSEEAKLHGGHIEKGSEASLAQKAASRHTTIHDLECHHKLENNEREPQRRPSGGRGAKHPDKEVRLEGLDKRYHGVESRKTHN